MNYKKVIIALLLVMCIGNNSIIYASGSRTQSIQTQEVEEEIRESYRKAGLDSPEVIINTLAELGITSQVLEEAVAKGEKIYDLLRDKQIEVADFKKALTKEYRSRISKARKDKVITRKEAKRLNNLLKEKMNDWEV